MTLASSYQPTKMGNASEVVGALRQDRHSGIAGELGATSQMTATATLSNGTTQDVTAQATWQSANTAVATVSSTGLVTGVAAGSAAITATYQNVSGIDTLSVNAAE